MLTQHYEKTKQKLNVGLGKVVFLLLLLSVQTLFAGEMVLEYKDIAASGVIELPLYDNVDVIVKWGDNKDTTVTTTGKLSHTYATAGDYTVTITGSLGHFGGDGVDGINKLRMVRRWNDMGLTSLFQAFKDAVNLTHAPVFLPSTVTNTSMMFSNALSFNSTLNLWDVSNVTTMSYMFANAKNFNKDISGWDVSNVTTMSHMFYGATSFNQNLGNWDVSNVTTMRRAFVNVSLSSENYSALLIGWEKLDLVDGLTLDMGTNKYGLAAQAARDAMIDPTGNDKWSIIDGGKEGMVLVYKGLKTIELPLYDTVNVIVDWGDGKDTTVTTSGDLSHTYATAGDYTIEITGILGRFGGTKSGGAFAGRDKLIKVTRWGDIGLTSLYAAFMDASNLIEIPANIPSTVTNTSFMFLRAKSFNHDIGNWDVSNVKNMSSMFFGTTSFNQDIGDWDVSNAINMNAMFFFATSFNQDIGNWDVSNVTNITDMFRRVSFSIENYSNLLIGWEKLDLVDGLTLYMGNNSYHSTAQDARDAMTDTTGNDKWTIIDGGKGGMVLLYQGLTATEKTIELPLYGTVNVNVFWGDGDTTKNYTTSGNLSHTYDTAGNYTVEIIGALEHFGASAVIGKDKLVKVTCWGNLGLTSLNNAFYRATSLIAVPIDIPSTVTNTSSMFSGASSFNQDVSSWDVSNITDMSTMFATPSFNQDIGGWDVSNVTNMDYMFSFATSFNQDIGNWDVSKVTSMSYMFYKASSYNHDIGNWNVSNVTNMDYMFSGASSFNHDIGNWDISNVTDLDSIFIDVSLSIENYTALLIGWEKLDLVDGLTLDMGINKYDSTARDARNAITNISGDDKWIIIDGGEGVITSIISTPVQTETTEFRIVPNPVSQSADAVYFLIPKAVVGKWEITIYDAIGNIMDETKFTTACGTTYSWDLHNKYGQKVTSGTYALIGRFTDENGKKQMFKKMIGVK